MDEQGLRRYVYAIFVLAFALRIGYAFVTPPFQAPDEYSHYSYVRVLHESGRLPVQPKPALRAEELQFHQPPLYYLMLAPLFPSTNFVESRPTLPLRIVTIAISMLTLVVTYRFASRFLPPNALLVGGMFAVVAFVPTFAYLSSTIQNGVLATFFASSGFYVSARVIAGEGTDRRWLGVGLVAGLALLSKLVAAGFVIAAAVIAVITSKSWGTLVSRFTWFVLGLALTSAWWFLWNQFSYGEWVRVVEGGFKSSHVDLGLADHLRAMTVTLFKTFWAVFGRINEIHFQDIYRVCWWFVGLSMLGLIRYFITPHRLIPVELMKLIVVAIVCSGGMTLYYAYNYDSDQGRYLFPVLLPIATLIGLGFESLVPARYHRWALNSIIFLLAGINVLIISRLASIYG